MGECVLRSTHFRECVFRGTQIVCMSTERAERCGVAHAQALCQRPASWSAHQALVIQAPHNISPQVPSHSAGHTHRLRRDPHAL